MMKNEKGYIDLGGAFLFLFIVGIIVGLFLTIGIPWLWSILKPLIHAVTA